MKQNFNHKPYAPGRLRALVAILLLAAAAASVVLSVFMNPALVGVLWGAGDVGGPYEMGVSLTELLYVGADLLQIVIFIAMLVAFLMWLHRAYRNLPALGANELDTTPGWAVAYFFIPFVNLVRPFLVVREVWHASKPDAGRHEEFGGGGASRSGTPALVGWWWTLLITASIAGRVGDRLMETTGTIEGMLLAWQVTIASDALFVIDAVLAILVVKRIDEMQEARFRQMGEQGPPPPPEHFDTYRTA